MRPVRGGPQSPRKNWWADFLEAAGLEVTMEGPQWQVHGARVCWASLERGDSSWGQLKRKKGLEIITASSLLLMYFLPSASPFEGLNKFPSPNFVLWNKSIPSIVCCDANTPRWGPWGRCDPCLCTSSAFLLPFPKTMCSSTAGTSCHQRCSSQFLYPVQCHHFINQIRRWHWVILSWLKWLSRSVLLTAVIFWKCQTACQDLAMSWISICWLRIQTLDWRRWCVTANPNRRIEQPLQTPRSCVLLPLGVVVLHRKLTRADVLSQLYGICPAEIWLLFLVGGKKFWGN